MPESRQTLAEELRTKAGYLAMSRNPDPGLPALLRRVADAIDEDHAELARAKADITRLCEALNGPDDHRERTPEEREATRAKFQELMGGDA